MDTAGTVLAVAGGCRAVEAARDALPHPVHVAFVTIAHGRLEASMDRIGGFVTTGLWPERCVAGTARLDFAGSEPAGGVGGLLPHCRRIAALPLRDRGAVRSPRSSLPSVGTSPWPNGESGMASRRCAGRVSPVRACANVAAPEAASLPVRLVSHGTCRVFTRRSRVRVPRFRRRCAASLV